MRGVILAFAVIALGVVAWSASPIIGVILISAGGVIAMFAQP